MTPPFDQLTYRRVLGHVPTGVVIVTLCDAGQPRGVTVGSFMSVSLDPPLIGCALRSTSTTFEQLERVGTFAVNVLGESQSHLGQRFGAADIDRFAGVAWGAGRDGAPLLDDAVAQLECTVTSVVDVGDHSLVIGAVRDLRVVSGSLPLVFIRGRFAAVAGWGRVETHAPAWREP